VFSLITFLTLINVSFTADAPPFYSLYQNYHFDLTNNFPAVPMQNLICVKDDNTRSLKFQLKTTQQVESTVIGISFVFLDF
jgi:hypothetical protein